MYKVTINLPNRRLGNNFTGSVLLRIKFFFNEKNENDSYNFCFFVFGII